MSTFRECRSMSERGEVTSPRLRHARGLWPPHSRKPDMSSMAGYLACGDHHLDTLAGAHQHSEALYRRVGSYGTANCPPWSWPRCIWGQRH